MCAIGGLIFQSRQRFRQFIEGFIEKARCHDQTGNHFRVTTVFDCAARIRLHDANFLEQSGETC